VAVALSLACRIYLLTLRKAEIRPPTTKDKINAAAKISIKDTAFLVFITILKAALFPMLLDCFFVYLN
jgi:hypothetical protein